MFLSLLWMCHPLKTATTATKAPLAAQTRQSLEIAGGDSQLALMGLHVLGGENQEAQSQET